MAKVYETLKKKNDTSVEVYPNIERTNIPDGAVNTAKLEDASVTTDKINDGAITDSKLASNSVGHSNIKDYSIFPSKIYDGAVTENKIANGAVTPNKLSFHLYAYVGSTLEFTDNGDNIVIYTPLILSTYLENTNDLRTDIDKFMNLWKKMYSDSYVYTRGSFNGTVYDVQLVANNPDVSEISVTINGNSYTISSSNYELLDCQRITIF